MIQMAVMAYQPLGLFRVHKEAFENLPMVHNLSHSTVSVYHRADLFFSPSPASLARSGTSAWRTRLTAALGQ